MSADDRFRPPAAAVADIPEEGIVLYFGLAAVVLLCLATPVQLAWAVLHDLAWLRYVARGNAPPLGLVLGAVVEICLVFGVLRMASRTDRGRFAFLAAWVLLHLHQWEARTSGGYMGKWPFVLGLATATAGWLVVRHRRRVIARVAAAMTASATTAS